MQKISRFRLVSTDDLQMLFDFSKSITEVVNKMGTASSNKFYRNILKNRINSGEISIIKMKQNLHDHYQNLYRIRYSNNDIFVIDSKCDRAIIKARIIKDNLMDYICKECGIIDEYNGKKIILDLDHINGVRDDNRLENLRFLCPNCHSQQNTSNGKNRIKTITYCTCGNVISKTSKLCKKCSSSINIIKIKHEKKFNPTREELEVLVKEKPMTELGKMFGVSDNAVKKRCKKLGIELRDMRGYWTKQKAMKIG